MKNNLRCVPSKNVQHALKTINNIKWLRVMMETSSKNAQHVDGNGDISNLI